MLEHLFGSKTRVKLLNIFFREPERAFFVRELNRLAGLQLHTVRRELSNLEAMGVVGQVEGKISGKHTVGTERSKYYKLITESLLFPELKALLLKAQVMEEQALIDIIKEKGGDVKLFILTGFFTNESEVETDIMLVGAIKPMVIAKIIRDYEKESQRSIRYTILTEAEFRERHEIGDKFLYSIFEAKHITAIDNLSTTVTRYFK